ncbi:MAG: SRPBCC family protein [Candidatus Korobacteraceae bacterium]|jgi:ligand-binding SRPBCC domain-containing protein
MSQRFEAEQWIAVPVPHVFAFFADPRNLPRIMPPKQATVVQLNLVPPPFPADAIPSDGERMAGVGTKIVFKFRAIPHLPMHEKWTALITEFSLNEYFVDTQQQGPFRRWHHTHAFEAKTVNGRDGTLISDAVEYEVGFGIIGRMLERLLFQRMLHTTFEYRKQALERIFSSQPPLAASP